MYEEALNDGIKLDGMVHCAGISGIRPLRSINKNYIDEVMSINYYTFVELTTFYAMKEYNNGGSVVGISSIAATDGELCQTVYSASKAALDAAVRTLAIELADKNIRVNSVMPGVVNTEMTTELNGCGIDMDSLAEKSVFGFAQPEQIAAPIAFLLSDMSSFITGRCIYVDGGRFL